jgi:hypothetical protein
MTALGEQEGGLVDAVDVAVGPRYEAQRRSVGDVQPGRLGMRFMPAWLARLVFVTAEASCDPFGSGMRVHRTLPTRRGYA